MLTYAERLKLFNSPEMMALTRALDNIIADDSATKTERRDIIAEVVFRYDGLRDQQTASLKEQLTDALMWSVKPPMVVMPT